MSAERELIRKAMLPAYVMDTTLPNLGRQDLRAIVQGKEFKTARGLTSYLLTAPNPPRIEKALAVFAKEIALQKAPILYVPLAAALREVRLHNYTNEVDPTYPLMAASGGMAYLAIADFCEIEPDRDGKELMGILQAHIAMGGGIIATSHLKQESLTSKLTASFSAMLEMFTTVNLK